MATSSSATLKASSGALGGGMLFAVSGSLNVGAWIPATPRRVRFRLSRTQM